MHFIRNFGLYVVAGMVVTVLYLALDAQQKKSEGAYIPTSPRTELNIRAEANMARLTEQRSNLAGKTDKGGPDSPTAWMLDDSQGEAAADLEDVYEARERNKKQGVPEGTQVVRAAPLR